MNTGSQQTNSAVGSSGTAKEIYERALSSQEYHAMAKHCSEKVLDRLMNIKPNSRSSALAKEIHEASGKGDIAKILSLSEELKTMQEEESERVGRLAEMRNEYSFEELLSAFHEDLEQVAYQLAIDILEGAQQAIKGPKTTAARTKRSRAPKTAKTYIIECSGQQIQAVPNTARPAAPSADREFYEFMGFELTEDGKALIPGSFTNAEGQEIAVISKKVIIDDLIAGNALWAEKGYVIRDSELPADSKSDQGDGPQGNQSTRSGQELESATA